MATKLLFPWKLIVILANLQYKEVVLDDYESLYLAISECKVEDEDLFNEDELE